MRKEKKYHFIYKTTNTLTGRYYYGMHSTDVLEDGYLGSGKRLRYSIRKYGEDKHKREIIEFCGDRKSLKQREREIITLNEVAKKDCLNLMVGGEGGFISVEQQRHRSVCAAKARTKLLNTDDEYKRKYSETCSKSNKKAYEKRERVYWFDWNGKKHKEESKRKIGEANSILQQGKKNSQYGTCWIYKDNENKKIKKELLDSFLLKGWIKGRKMGV